MYSEGRDVKTCEATVTKDEINYQKKAIKRIEKMLKIFYEMRADGPYLEAMQYQNSGNAIIGELYISLKERRKDLNRTKEQYEFQKQKQKDIEEFKKHKGGK